MFEKEVRELNSTWAYKYDLDQFASKDHWRIMKEHPHVGDCEDYALTLLWLICDKSMWKFWWKLFTFQAQIRRVITKNNVGHAVLRYGDAWADNWTRKFVNWEEMEALGHKKDGLHYWPLTVAIKLLIAKFSKKKK